MLEESIEMMELCASRAYTELCTNYEKKIKSQERLIYLLISIIGALMCIITLISANNKEDK